MIKTGREYLYCVQKDDGSFGGDATSPASLEETAVALQALVSEGVNAREKVLLSVQWLVTATASGTRFPPAPIGLYFARLWYHEQLYPVIWTLSALCAAKKALLLQGWDQGAGHAGEAARAPGECEKH